MHTHTHMHEHEHEHEHEHTNTHMREHVIGRQNTKRNTWTENALTERSENSTIGKRQIQRIQRVFFFFSTSAFGLQSPDLSLTQQARIAVQLISHIRLQ
jgi:hypothetical protein